MSHNGRRDFQIILHGTRDIKIQLPVNRVTKPYDHQLLARKIEQMKKGASLLEGTHDFTSFRGQNSVPSSPIRHIHRIDLKKSDKGIHLFVTGEGFLYHMVRNMAGALADIGRGKLSLEDIPDILQAKDRKRLGVTAPAKGLCLLKVYFQPITNNEIDNTLQGNYFPWNI